MALRRRLIVWMLLALGFNLALAAFLFPYSSPRTGWVWSRLAGPVGVIDSVVYMELPGDRVMTVLERPPFLEFERMGMARRMRPAGAAAFTARELGEVASRSLRETGAAAIVVDGDDEHELGAWYGSAPDQIEALVHVAAERSPCVAFWMAGFPFKFVQSARIAAGVSWIDTASAEVAVLRGPSFAVRAPGVFSARLYLLPLAVNCVLLAGAACGAAYGARGLRRRWRVRRGRCGVCGYAADLGLLRCPECGAESRFGVGCVDDAEDVICSAVRGG